MTPDQRQAIVHARTADYNNVMRTTLFTFLGIGAVLYLGDGRFSMPLIVLAVVTTAYGVLAGGTALDDINALKGDMDEETASTSYGGGVMGRDVLMLKMISAGCVGLIGLACVLGILI